QRMIAPTPAAWPRRLDVAARAAAPGTRVAVLGAGAEISLALRDAARVAEEAAAQARSLAALLDEAFAALAEPELAPDDAHPTDAASQPKTAALSPREQEVLALVAEGRSNKAIATALFVSPNTIKTHVASLLTKLNADTRAQLAVIATRRAARGEEWAVA
ncbi:MAG TPA: response regulator transcription factor, partial [Thermomicrobiales bacterium]|nr:response regulator transcription factor [Thermomicrobiales bacterium]